MSVNKTPSVLGILLRNLARLARRRLSPKSPDELSVAKPPALRSLFIRHLDCGSCNGCELELNSLNNPVYDIERFGIRFESSPRHADLLVMTGPFTHNLAEAAALTFEAMPEPRHVVTVGDCAKDGGVFKDSYAVATRPPEIEGAVRAHVPGCPPTPEQILQILTRLR